ncbi:hypothetical protein, partial [Bradyrhizobium sp. I1.7.5]
APPIARCSHRAKRRNIRRDSNRYWVKLQGQVNFTNDCRLGPTALQRSTITATDRQYRHLHEATIFLPEDMISIETA